MFSFEATFAGERCSALGGRFPPSPFPAVEVLCLVGWWGRGVDVVAPRVRGGLVGLGGRCGLGSCRLFLLRLPVWGT